MSIHQETIIDAAPERIYAVLTNGEQFAAATGLPAVLSDREGEAFSIFGGRIEGRQIELVQSARVVQAWRFGREHPDEWDAGVYSVVRFTLKPEGDATRFVVDHEAIPTRWNDYIADNYSAFYQEPLARYLAAGGRTD